MKYTYSYIGQNEHCQTLQREGLTFRFDRVEAHRFSILPEDFGKDVFSVAQERHLIRTHFHRPVNDAV